MKSENKIEIIKFSIIPVYDVEKGKEGNIYSSVNPWITKENCPIIQPAEQEIKEMQVALVSFGCRSMKTEEIPAALDDIQMKVAGPEHLLGAGIEHSKWHIDSEENKKIGRIIALGEPFPCMDDSVILYIDCLSILSRNLCIANHKNMGWYVHTSYFLAVAK